MLTLVIQAGGKSKRMGEDKALLPFLGKPLVERIYDTFSGAADETVVITNTPEDYQFLPVQLYSDLIPDRGALGGLYTALKVASHPLVGLIACDLPFASPQLIDYCRQVLTQTGADAVIPSDPGGIQPLHAVYRAATCLPPVKQAIDNDLWRMIDWHKQANVRILTPEQTARHDPHPHTFWNINTPEEFSRAEEIARKLENGSLHP